MNHEFNPNLIWTIQIKSQKKYPDNSSMEKLELLQKFCVVYNIIDKISYDKFSYDTKKSPKQIKGEFNHGR